MTDEGTVTSGAPPPPGPAVAHAPTRRALARYRWVPAWYLLAAVVLGAAGTGLAVVGAPDPVWLAAAGMGAAGLVVAVLRAIRARWLRRVLTTEPWVARDARHFVIGPGEYSRGVVVLEADGDTPEALCTVEESGVSSLSIVDGPIVVWVAGDPTRRAVATAGHQDLVVIAPVRWGWRRRQIQEGIDRRESGTRPDLYHPEGRAPVRPAGRPPEADGDPQEGLRPTRPWGTACRCR